MCRRFNEMAAAIAVQRRAQMTFWAASRTISRTRSPRSGCPSRYSIRARAPPPRISGAARSNASIVRSRMDRMLGDFLDIAVIEASELELRLDEHDARTMVTTWSNSSTAIRPITS